MKEVVPWSSDLDPKIPKDVKMAHAKVWGAACPELVRVGFLDGSFLDKAFGWTPR